MYNVHSYYIITIDQHRFPLDVYLSAIQQFKTIVCGQQLLLVTPTTLQLTGCT